MKEQNKSSLSKANSTTKDLNNWEEEEITNIEFHKIIVRMISELKVESQKLVSNLKRHVINI
jgi:hypothetical protein